MNTIENTGVPAVLEADKHAVIDHVMTGKPLDPDIVRRVQERADHIRQEIREKGVPNFGTQVIREMRGALDEEQERELTLAQRDLVRNADGPVRLLDPDTDEVYLLVREDEFDRLRSQK